MLLAPTNAAALMILCGLALAWLRPGLHVGWRLALAGAVLFVGLAALPLGDWMMGSLEGRFPVFRPDARPVAGVIVLGGGVSVTDAPGHPDAQLNEAADRLFETARLAQAYPNAPVVVSGGPVDPASGRSEADFAADVLARLGVTPGRVLRERRSRDTYENARFSAAMLHPSPGQRWLLVTSAFHMPRAIGSFRKAGFQVTAAPTDWRARRGWSFGGWSASANLRKVDLAAKEYVGLVSYYLRARTSALFPAP